MNLELELPENLGIRLRDEALKLRIQPEKAAVRLLERALPESEPLSDKQQRAIEMLDRWAKEDEEASEEELACNRAVLAAIDEDRPSFRKLFEEVLAEETE